MEPSQTQTDQPFGLQEVANIERELYHEVDETKYARLPIRTKIVPIGYSYMSLVKEFVVPYHHKDDILIISEKVISICQKRVVHESEVNPSWLAKFICKFVTKYPDDVGFENPRKMQVAINEAGYFRMVLAVVGGGVMKFVFRKPGYFYSIAGHEINVIDGFNPIAIPPFNEYAMLAPAHPTKVCKEIEDNYGIFTVIVDASNVATAILGKSRGVKWDDQHLQMLIDGNPMGQGDEQTPMLLVRKV